nr:MAG: hypothetical protein [Bacteriophage sp.]
MKMINMHRLKLGTLKLPEVYVCKNQEAVDTCRTSGIPYIKWFYGTDTDLILSIMLPALEKAMPGVDWYRMCRSKGGRIREVTVITPPPVGYAVENDSEWNINTESISSPEPTDIDEFDPVGVDVDEDFDEVETDSANVLRRCGGDASPRQEENISIEDFLGSSLSKVDPEIISEMGLMPKFLGEIEENIRYNIMQSLKFRDSYNKKLGCCVGNFDNELPSSNLLILDVSASIPWGVADTLLKMVDTMREQANADLIVHAAHSVWFAKGDKLPSPGKLRRMCPRGQEAQEFSKIIKEHVCGRSFDNVISFGDYDAPWCGYDDVINTAVKENPPSVGKLWCYHVYAKDRTGFTQWVDVCSPNCEKEYKTGWAKCMKE